MAETQTRRIPTWLLIAGLMVLALSLRAGMIFRSQATARDAIGFVKYASRFEQEPFTKVIHDGEHPPGYPIAVLAVSWPVRWWLGGSSCDSWLLSAQIASAICGVLIVIPLYLLGRDLSGRMVGLIAAAVFQALPMWIRLTSDGLSESLFLLLSATAMYFSSRGLRLCSYGSLTLAGIAAGAAFLTRPEGGEIAVAAIVAAALAAFMQRQPWTWQRSLAGTAAMIVGLVTLVGPYVAVTGSLTKKNTAKMMFGDNNVDRTGISAAPTKHVIAAFYVPEKDGGKIAWGLQTLASESFKSLHYVVAGLAAVGLFLARSRIRSTTAWTLLVILLAMHTILLWRMAIVIGYLSERHTAMYALIACVPAAIAILAVSAKLATRIPIRENVLAGLTVALLFAGAMPTLARPMHSNRAGHCAAGRWLAEHASPQAEIMDPFGWGGYYAGRVFHDETAKEPSERYIILELTDNQHSRLPQLPAAKANAAKGTMVYHWPENVPAEKAVVAVYHRTGLMKTEE